MDCSLHLKKTMIVISISAQMGKKRIDVIAEPFVWIPMRLKLFNSSLLKLDKTTSEIHWWYQIMLIDCEVSAT